MIDMNADLVIFNGKIVTVDRDFKIKQAVAVKDGRGYHGQGHVEQRMPRCIRSMGFIPALKNLQECGSIGGIGKTIRK